MTLIGICRKLLVLSALLVIPAASVFADPQACSSFTTLQDYIGAGSTGCQLGDKVVSNFSFLFSGGTSSESATMPLVPASSQVTVTTGLADNSPVPSWVSLTFNFNGNAAVSAYQSMDLKIQYVVTTNAAYPYDSFITRTAGSGVGAVRSQATGKLTSQADLTTKLCVEAPFNVSGVAPTGTCPAGYQRAGVLDQELFAKTTNNSKDPSSIINQNSVSGSSTQIYATQVGVYNYLELMGGSTLLPLAASPQAAISSVTNTFYEAYEETPVPEPASFLLMGAAVLSLAVAFQRKKTVV